MLYDPSANDVDDDLDAKHPSGPWAEGQSLIHLRRSLPSPSILPLLYSYLFRSNQSPGPQIPHHRSLRATAFAPTSNSAYTAHTTTTMATQHDLPTRSMTQGTGGSDDDAIPSEDTSEVSTVLDVSIAADD